MGMEVSNLLEGEGGDGGTAVDSLIVAKYTK
jgi:hypothetical protein